MYNVRFSKKDYALLFINLSSFLWKDYAGAPICKRLSSPRIDSKESIPQDYFSWARIWKRLRSPWIDSEGSIPPA